MKTPFLVWMTVFVFLCNCDDVAGTYRPPDAASAPDMVSNLPLGTFCNSDRECESNKCMDFGGTTICSRSCDSHFPCPDFSNWSCGSQLFCECAVEGKQPDVCDVDGDCDGKADREILEETCNLQDDDCNGEIDDVAANTPGAALYYQDLDGDGFGFNPVFQWFCEPKEGWTEQDNDCDDTIKEINPDAVEVCGDTHDNDCDKEFDDVDVCGRAPLDVSDVNDPLSPSSTLKICGANVGIDSSVDIIEILGKQDNEAIKFTIRLAAAPATDTCSTYRLSFGSDAGASDLVYIYRLASIPCGFLLGTEVYLKGKAMSSQVKTSFNAADPGHVSFVIPKTELFQRVPKGSYHTKACSSLVANPVKDITDCFDDECETPVRR
ncbi:MAG: putative metal-binding motif-containing protein [Pseudomonadota bacterium]